ncbi:MAG: ABC-F family ATP-binding cassette domain-containing protein, partial [Lentisphaerae bacterium]|nr:ABC-F family ATP-binding cassette domain-containing protein [Lentisphaerota bacterium]
DHDRQLKRLGDLQTEFEHQGGYQVETRAKVALGGLGFSTEDFARPFNAFSGGWQMRAELARTLVGEPDVLLLDEPTNYLDVPAVEWLRGFLGAFPGTLLLISHDRYLLNTLTRVTIEVVATQVTRYSGPYNWYMEQREQRYLQQLSAAKNQNRKREQVERFVERFRSKNTKASQVQSRVKMLEKMEVVTPVQLRMKPPRITLPPPPHSGVEVARLDDVGFAYSPGKWILRNIDVRIERGEKAAIVGLNGMGKTTLLRILAGALAPVEGKRVLGHHVNVGYLSQDFTDVMDPNATVFETARRATAERSDGEIRDLLGAFRFSGDAVTKTVQVLSGGEKVRLALSRLLLQPCNLLLLDEPTTHLDVESRESLELALRDHAGTLCLVSHDIEFVRHLAQKIIAITPSGIKLYHGGYDYYREKLAAETAAQTSLAVETPATTGDERKARKREQARLRQEFFKERQPLEKRVEKCEAEVEDLEAEQAELVGALEKGDTPDMGALSQRLGRIQQDLSQATSAWEEAALELEALTEAYQQRLGTDA